jgi:hypothetical protein
MRKRLPILTCLAAMAAGSASAQIPDAGAASLLEALALISGQLLAPPLTRPEVSRDGTLYRVHVPVPGLTAPAGAAIEIEATQRADGSWDIGPVVLPSAGTVALPSAGTVALGSADSELAFSLGSQDIRASVDPTLALVSTYSLTVRDIQVSGYDRSSGPGGAEPPLQAHAGLWTAGQVVTGGPDGRMTQRTSGAVEDFGFTARENGQETAVVTLDKVDVAYSARGVDRARARELGDLARPVQRPRPGPGETAEAQRQRLLRLFDLTAGLMTGFDLEESFQGLHIETADATLDLGEAKLVIAAEETDTGVSGRLDIGISEPALSSLPEQYAPYLPRKALVRAAFGGIPADGLRRWMHDALTDGDDVAENQRRALALLDSPGARAGIEAMLIQSGPMTVQGSAQVKPQADGTAAVEMHLSARGLDEMLALVQADPAAQQILPVLYLLKGMGRKEGDSVAWDIGFAHGALTVNGVPMGAPQGRAPEGRAPEGGRRQAPSSK